MKAALEISPLRRKYGLLLEQHAAMLEASGISPEVAAARGYLSIETKTNLARRGFSPAQRRIPGLLVPGWGVDGKKTFPQYRPDTPRLRDGKPIKYETRSKVRMALDVHPFAREWLGDPSRPLVITEGVKKGDAAVSRGVPAVVLYGVWNWRGRNAKGGKVALPDFENIALNDRDVYVIFDSDITVKAPVRAALARFVPGLSILPGGWRDFAATASAVDLAEALRALRAAPS